MCRLKGPERYRDWVGGNTISGQIALLGDGEREKQGAIAVLDNH